MRQVFSQLAQGASWFAGASLFAGLLSVVLIPWVIGRLPVDYFVWPEKRFVFDRKRSSTWLFLAKNLYGVAFVLIGVALLILPGPGPVTILLGIALLDLPRKHRLVVHFASKSPLQRTLQWLRRRTGGDPFKFPPR